jgi:hypothetical protein
VGKAETAGWFVITHFTAGIESDPPVEMNDMFSIGHHIAAWLRKHPRNGVRIMPMEDARDWLQVRAADWKPSDPRDISQK